MSILISRDGDIFLEFLRMAEKDIKKYTLDAPLTHSLVVGKYEGKYLLMFNTWRQYWELPGGIIDDGETPRASAIRELFEETN